MRIALLAHTDAPWTPLYAAHFAAAGHIVTILSFCPDSLPNAAQLPATCTVTFVGDLPYNPAGNKTVFLRKIPRVRALLRQFRPDVVFAPYLLSNGLCAALAWRGPLVVTAVGSDVLQQAGTLRLPPLVRRALVTVVARRARWMVAVSEELAQACVQLGAKPGQVKVFPVGIDVQAFQPGPKSQPGQPLAVVCVRKHAPVYENHVLLQAIALLRQQHAQGRPAVPLTCTFAGSGPLLASFRQQVKALSLQDCVTVLGHVDHAEVASLLAAADVSVSCTSSDGTSAALLEGMASGALPVVTDITANQGWVVPGVNGLQFPVGDVVALAAALRQASQDFALRDRALHDNPPRVAAQADIAVNMGKVLEMLEDAWRRG